MNEHHPGMGARERERERDYMAVGIPPTVIHSHAHTNSSIARIVPPPGVKLQGEYG